MNGVEYKDFVLQRIAHTEGAVTRQVYAPTGAVSYNHEYVLRDHLGNTRVTFTDANNDGVVGESDIKQINNYYPFGLNMEGNWNGSFPEAKNKYQYNEKELNSDFGLEWNDYGARFYDGSSCRWLSPDPMSEKYMSWSPYNYVMNNPIKFIDPDGMQTETKVVNVADGSIIYDDGKIDGNLYLVEDKNFSGQTFHSLDEVQEKYGKDLITASLASVEEYSQKKRDWQADESWTNKYVRSQMNFMGLPPERFTSINDLKSAKTYASVSRIFDPKNNTTTMEFGYGDKVGLMNPLVFRQSLVHEKKHARDIIEIANGIRNDYKDFDSYERAGYRVEAERYIKIHFDKKTGKPKDLPMWYQRDLINGAALFHKTIILPGKE